jgi:hypothetical protein
MIVPSTGTSAASLGAFLGAFLAAIFDGPHRDMATVRQARKMLEED